MKPAIILLALLAVSGIILYAIDRLLNGRDTGGNDNGAAGDDIQHECTAYCCGTNSVCPSEKLLLGINSELVYFNDEELDAFKGRTADDYTDSEIDAFRDVLYTLRKDELLAWQQSVKRRGITMPAAIHDEFIMLYNEPNPASGNAINAGNSR